MMDVFVAACERLAPGLRLLTLQPIGKSWLPPFEPGSHVEVHPPVGKALSRSAYSLTGCAQRRDAYQIVVRLRPESGPVSRWLHDEARAGCRLRISEPRCGLRLATEAQRHLLFAGGVGITAFLSHLKALQTQRAAYELYYSFHSREQGALGQQLREQHGARVTLRVSSEEGRLPLLQILRRQPPETHVYFCGPRSFMQAVFDHAVVAGFGDGRIHWDRHGWFPKTEPERVRPGVACPAAVLAT
jgi:dimethylamine monooxygenase subunit B